jgi:hypothetical protein
LNRARTVPTSASAQTTPDLAAEETRDRAHARAVIEEIVEGFQALGDRLLEHVAPGLLDDFGGAYGAEPATLWAESYASVYARSASAMWGGRAGSLCERERAPFEQ